MEVAMLTYSTRARGGVAHALKLSEHLRGLGVEVSLHTLSRNDDRGFTEFYRDTNVPFSVYGFDWDDDVVLRLENMIQSYMNGLPKDADVYHAQDCVGGTALHMLKQKGGLAAPTFRTVHHIDDFAEPRLFEFEKRAVRLADHRFVVSEYWRNAFSAITDWSRSWRTMEWTWTTSFPFPSGGTIRRRSCSWAGWSLAKVWNSWSCR